MARENPKENAGVGRHIRIRSVTSFADPDAAPLITFSGLLAAVVFIILWIACVNVAGVLIARAAARRRKIATRLAIGASRGRLVRQLLAEALLLARLGTLAGLSLHWYVTKLLNELSLPLPVPIALQIAPDLRLVLYAITLTALATLLSGLLPAWQATRPALVSGLRMEEPQYGHRWFTFRNGLIVTQVAITTVLLSVGLLFARSLARVHSIDPGFDLKHTVWAKVNVLSDRYTKDQIFLFASGLLDAAEGVPGVQSAALAEVVPFNNFMRIGSVIQTKTSAVKTEYFGNSVSPAYFEAMGIPLASGRPFTAADRMGSPNVVILNTALSKRLFGDGSGVGERIWFGNKKEGPGVEVVGIAANSKHLTMGENQAHAVYDPIARTQLAKSEINVLVRAGADATSVVAGLRERLTSLDDTAAVEVGTLRTRLAFAYLPAQIGAVFAGSLGALGLILALIGIYGTMVFAVSRRTAEIGIRMALGASTRQVLSAILGTPFTAVCAGLAVGTGLSVLAAYPVASFLA